MQSEHDVRSRADLDAAIGVQALASELIELLEETRDVDDAAGTEQIFRLVGQQTGWKDVKVVFDAGMFDGVTSIVAASRTRAETKRRLSCVQQDVDEFS